MTHWQGGALAAARDLIELQLENINLRLDDGLPVWHQQQHTGSVKSVAVMLTSAL